LQEVCGIWPYKDKKGENWYLVLWLKSPKALQQCCCDEGPGMQAAEDARVMLENGWMQEERAECFPWSNRNEYEYLCTLHRANVSLQWNALWEMTYEECWGEKQFADGHREAFELRYKAYCERLLDVSDTVTQHLGLDT
jgi:hypothetical protein